MRFEDEHLAGKNFHPLKFAIALWNFTAPLRRRNHIHPQFVHQFLDDADHTPMVAPEFTPADPHAKNF